MKLNLFEEAINWCDQGLSVSLETNAITFVSYKKKINIKLWVLINFVLKIADRVQHLYLRLKLLQCYRNHCLNVKKNDPGNEKLLKTRNMCTNARGTCDDEAQKQKEERAHEGMTYATLGNECLTRGDLKGAVEYHQQYLTITQEIGDRLGEGRACRSLGDRYYSLQDFEKAVEYHQKYLAVSKEIGDRVGEGRACGKLGLAYYSYGNFQKAIQYFQQNLSFTQEKGNKAEEGRAYSSLGNAHLSLGNFQEAIDFYKERLNIAKDLGDKTGEGRTYSNLGRAYFSLNNFEKAAEYHKLYLSFTSDAGDKAAECGACVSLGNDYLSLCDFQKATDFYQLGLSIAKEVGDKAGEGRAYSSLGSACFRRGEFKKSRDYYERDREIAEEVGDKAGVGRAHGNLGSVYYSLGSFEDAITSYQSSLNIASELGDKASEGRVYGNLGNVYDSQGLVDKAVECHQLRLSVAKELKDRVGESSAYLNLGNAYHSLGDFTKAIDNHNLSLEIAKEVGDRLGEENAYGSLGTAYGSTGKFQLATYYHELELKTAKELGDKVAEGRAYGSLGIDYRRLGEFNKAIKNHEKCLRIAEEMDDGLSKGRCYGNLGNVYFSLGNFEKAKENVDEHLKIAKTFGDKAAQGKALNNLGCCYMSLEPVDFEKANDQYELRLGISKEIGDRAGEGRAYGNLSIVQDSLGNREKAIEYNQIGLGIAKEIEDKDLEGNCCGNLGVVYHSLGDLQKSIEYHEQHLSISRESGDTVGQARAYGNLGKAYHSLGDLSKSEEFYKLSVDQYDAVRNRLESNDDEWKISLRNQNDEVYIALVTVLLKQDKITEALLASERGRAQALMDLMKSQYGVHLAVSQPGGKQSDILKTLSNISSQTVFIAFGERELNFWVLKKEEDVKFRRKEIGNAYLKKKVLEYFESLRENAYAEIRVNRDVQCENRALEEPTVKDFAGKRSEEEGGMSHNKSNPLTDLFELIINPILDLIQGSELIIVPDGPLFLAPFAAFRDRCLKFLCESFTIRLVPSLSTLKLMAECSERHCSDGEALLVGDPWVAEVKRKGKKRLEQLEFAKKEVEMIGEILNVIPLVREKATKAEVVRRLASAPMVHIAAHGSMNTGEIALTPNPPTPERRYKEEDYMLTMEDVLKIQLRARLVVLSCCHSARGEVKVEGVVGIARAFLGAGARSVLVSLWAINDEATLEFMRCFYQNLAEGKRASVAINEARKCLRESEGFSDVKHWAPFMLVGDDVTLDLGKKG